ncbi:sulfotransferase family protein [Litoreibacter janthinus]|nr:sulfotransferase [Litoreibacter janthinus]
MSLTRFHFVAGLPKSGARYFASLLAQNSRFCVSSDSPAHSVFCHLTEAWAQQDGPLSFVDASTRTALLRASMDAVHHGRAMDSVVFDNNPEWLPHMASLAELFPLSRFILLVRDPARIAAEMAQETGGAQTPAALMSDHGVIGKPVGCIQAALTSKAAERLLLIDYDRLLSDPERVMNAMYSFLGDVVFTHDFRALPPAAPRAQRMPMGLARRVAAIGDGTRRRIQKNDLPIWRRSSGSAATMLLPEAG